DGCRDLDRPRHWCGALGGCCRSRPRHGIRCPRRPVGPAAPAPLTRGGAWENECMSRNADNHTVEAWIRPVPRFGVFLGLGAALGVILAGILTAVGSYEKSAVVDVIYPPGQVFGFALLWMVPIGIAL